MFEEIYDENSGHIILEVNSMRDKIKKALIKGFLIRGFFGWIHKIIKKAYIAIDSGVGTIGRYILFRNEPIRENRVVFYTFQGKYTCNSKYIAEKLIELHPEYEVIFVVSKKVKDRTSLNVPENVKFVVKETAEAYYALSTAKYWFDNALCCIWRKVPKRKGQIYINTWHGSLGIKRLSGNKRWEMIAKYGNRQIDYFLTNSVFEEQVFTESFWPNVKHMKVGHPRNDIFFDQEKLIELKKKIYAYYGIEEHVKTALYAPTFRDNKKDVSSIVIDYIRLKSTLEIKFGGEWKILVRPHFHNIKEFKLEEIGEHVINACSYDDMQELMAAVDVGITDYSSWIFDYILTRRPAFIYARDIEKYVNSRGFYYSLNETPFSIAKDDDSLNNNIMRFNQESYEENVKKFLESKGCYENGTASEAVVKYIVNERI